MINLINAYHNKKLAPFYILKGKNSLSYLYDFLTKILKKEKCHHLDILHLKKDADNKEFKLSDYTNELNTFLSYSPLKLQYKFIIFHDAQYLPTRALNKLLTTLESPPKKFCIIFLNSSQNLFLQTIESRAITIFTNTNYKLSDSLNRIDNNEEKKNKDNLSFIKDFFNEQISFNKYILNIKKLKSKTEVLKKIIEIDNNISIQHKSYQLQIIKDFNQAFIYNRGTVELIAAYSLRIMNINNKNKNKNII